MSAEPARPTPRGALLALRGLVAAAVVALGVVLGGAAGEEAGPPQGAARLVPAGALVYVHVALDTERAATRQAAALAERFPSYAALRDGLVQRVDAPGCRLGSQALAEADEAALALFDTKGGATANSLVLVDTGKEHPGTARRRCGALSAQYVGRFLALGQPASLDVAQDLAAGKGQALADLPRFAEVAGQMPADRVADGWASRDGVERLLAPQGGLLGAAGVLLDQPALLGAGFAVRPQGRDRATLWVRSLSDPRRQRKGRSPFRTFTPSLAGSVPADAMAYLGVTGLETALRRLLAAAGSDTQGLAPLVDALDDDVLALFKGEVALILQPQTPAPVLTVVAKAPDEAKARRAIAGLPKRIRQAFSPTVVGGKVIVSTARSGVRAVTGGGERLTGTTGWRALMGSDPKPGTSVLFLDFTRLLRLGEQTGLDSSKAYRQVADDLSKVRAIGARTSSDGSESTAEISLLIP